MSFKNILPWLSPLGAFLTGGALLLILHTHGHLIEFTFLRYLLIWVPIIVLAAIFPRRELSRLMPKTALASAELALGEASLKAGPLAKPGLSAVILLVFLVLYLFSSSTDYTWFYFLLWLPRITFDFHIFQSQLGQFVLLTALLTPFLMFKPGKIDPWLLALLLFTIAGSTYYGKLVDYIRMAHPVLIFMGLGGVITAVNGKVRRWFLPLILLLLLIAGWGPEIMPDFQLFRTIIPLFFVAVIPASLAINELLSLADPKLALLCAAIIALLIVGAANTIMLFGNGSRAPYETLSRAGYAMVEWIRSNAPEGTRVLFAGSTLHGYEGGHVAFMQYMAGREMMACDYYHFSPAAVEYDYPPKPWRRNAEFFNRFLELYNVSVITTLRDKWKDYLRSRPAEYLEGKSFGEGKPLTFFRVVRPPASPSFALRVMADKSEGSAQASPEAPPRRAKASLFLMGAGKVKAGFNKIEVELAGANDQAVIKYNWQPGLIADNPSEIFPYHAGPGVRFIGINPHGQKHIVIRYK